MNINLEETLSKLDNLILKSNNKVLTCINTYNKFKLLGELGDFIEELTELENNFKTLMSSYSLVNQILDLKINNHCFDINLTTPELFKKSFVGSRSTYKRKLYKIISTDNKINEAALKNIFLEVRLDSKNEKN